LAVFFRQIGQSRQLPLVVDAKRINDYVALAALKAFDSIDRNFGK
jgi:hypothetical protein